MAKTLVEYRGFTLEYNHEVNFKYEGRTFKYVGHWANYIDSKLDNKLNKIAS